MNLKQIVVIIVLIVSMINLPMDGEGREIQNETILRDDPPLEFTPILIDGNSDLVNQSSSNGWPGNGTESNPYIIEGLVFPRYEGYALEIKNVNLHINMKNCSSQSYLHETSIHLKNVSNIIMENLSIQEWGQLIYAYQCSCIKLTDIKTHGHGFDYWGYFNGCKNLSISKSNLKDRTYVVNCINFTFFNNRQDDYNLQVQKSNDINILSNKLNDTNLFRFTSCVDIVIKNNSRGPSYPDGFSIYNCEQVLISSNNMSGSGGHIDISSSRNVTTYDNQLGRWGLKVGGELSDIYTMEIPLNNTIDGLPILVLMDNNLTPFKENPNHSQLIMINMSSLRISGNDHEAYPECFELIYSNDILIDNLSISNSFFGISMYDCSRISIENCTMEDLQASFIEVENSEELYVKDCNFKNGSYDCFNIIDSSELRFISCNITDNHGSKIFEMRSSVDSVFIGLNIKTGYVPFDIRNCEQIRIEGCNISSSSSVNIEDSNSIIIRKNRIETFYGGVSLEDNNEIYIVDNTIISGSDIGISGSDTGVYQEDCFSVSYYSNQLIGGDFLFIIDSPDDLDIILPSNNSLDGRPVLFMTSGNNHVIGKDEIWGQIIINKVNNYRIEDLTITNRSHSIQAFSSSGLKIHNLSFKDTGSCIRTYNCGSMRITDSGFSNSSTCILLEYSPDLFIEKCCFYNSENGITIIGERNDEPENVKILDCFFTGIERSIYVEHTNNIDVDNCFFKGGKKAISFSGVSRGFIRNCDLRNLSGTGVSYPGVETKVYHNIFINVSTGLRPSHINRQEIHDNLFAECPGYAILTDGNPYHESTSWFYSNIFINNNGAGEEFNSSHIQARCDNNADYWNNSYLRGNYWSDWTGPDLNNDGIVDEPYPLSGEVNHDNYPLVDHPFRLIGPPINISGTVGNGNVSVSWDEPEWNRLDSIEGFKIYRDSQGEETQVFDVEGGMDSFNDTTIVNEKRYAYRITALNQYGESVLSESIDLIGDGTSPFFHKLDPVNNTIFNRSDVKLEWEVLDDGTGFYEAWISLDDGEWVRADSINSHTLVNLTDGIHHVIVKAIDKVSNPVTRMVSFIVDTTPPVLDIWSDLEAVITNRTTVGINWSAEDPITGIGYYMISINYGGWEYWGNKTSFSFNDISTGNHTLRVMGVDNAGNQNVTALGFQCDTDRPFIRFTSPDPGTLIEEDAVTFNWDLTETGSGLMEILFSLDDEDFYLIPNTGTITISDINPGKHETRIKAVDLAGNWAHDRIEFLTGEIATLVSISPEGDNVPMDSSVEVVLSKNIRVLDLRLEGVNGTLTISGNKAVFAPDSALDPSTQYRVNFSGFDIDGLPFDPFNWTFTTIGYAEVKGTLVDENSNILRDVEVYANGLMMMKTGQTGDFFLSLENGHYKLIFYKDGYDNSTIEIDVIMGDKKDLGEIVLLKESTIDEGEKNADEFPIVPVLILVILVVLIIIIALIIVARRKTSANDEGNETNEKITEGEDVGDLIRESATTYEDLYGPADSNLDQSFNEASEEDYFMEYDNPPME